MKLAIDLACMATARTGAAVYIRELLAAIKKDKQTPDLIELKPKAYPIKRFGPLGKIWNNIRLYYWIQHQLGKYSKNQQAEVILSPEYLTPKRGTMPRMVVVYDAAFAKRPQDYNLLWRLLFQNVYLPAMRSAELIITITEVAKYEISHYFGIDKNKIAVITPACDTNFYKMQAQPLLDAILEKYQLKQNHYFIHVGVMEKRKNLVKLVEAFAKVKTKYSSYKLLLVGQPGPKLALNDYHNIQAVIKAHGLEQDVLLPGFLPFEEVPLLYQGACAMVFPTIYEGFGIPILEAMACGTPVVCSALDVLKEVAGDGALYVDPQSPIDIAAGMNTILEQPEKVKQLKQHGHEQLQRYSWQKSAKEIIALAKQLIHNNSNSPA